MPRFAFMGDPNAVTAEQRRAEPLSSPRFGLVFSRGEPVDCSGLTEAQIALMRRHNHFREAPESPEDGCWRPIQGYVPLWSALRLAGRYIHGDAWEDQDSEANDVSNRENRKNRNIEPLASIIAAKIRERHPADWWRPSDPHVIGSLACMEAELGAARTVADQCEAAREVGNAAAEAAGLASGLPILVPAEYEICLAEALRREDDARAAWDRRKVAVAWLTSKLEGKSFTEGTAIQSIGVEDDGRRHKLQPEWWGIEAVSQDAFALFVFTCEVPGRPAQVQMRPYVDEDDLRRALAVAGGESAKTALPAEPMGETAEGGVLSVTRTGLAGRPSSRDLYRDEAKRRCASDRPPPTLAALSTDLREWLREKHPDAPRAQPRSIGNAVRDIWRACNGAKA